MDPGIGAATVIAVASSIVSGLVSAQAAAARRIAIDEAHHNVMATASGGYRPLVSLLTAAGFEVRPNTLSFRPERLATTDVAIIANPNGADESAPVERRALPAFTDSEIETIAEWVQGGGGLLLATSHYPTGVSAARLAERFGVKLSGGWTDDPANRWVLPADSRLFGSLVFSLENGLLADHAITRGQDEWEKIEGVATIAGESIEGPPGSVSILRLSPTAVDWIPTSAAGASPNGAAQGQASALNPCPSCDQVSSAGRSQGIAFAYGRGRVVVLGEMSALVNYSVPGMQNDQFALNAVRWLARER